MARYDFILLLHSNCGYCRESWERRKVAFLSVRARYNRGKNAVTFMVLVSRPKWNCVFTFNSRKCKFWTFITRITRRIIRIRNINYSRFSAIILNFFLYVKILLRWSIDRKTESGYFDVNFDWRKMNIFWFPLKFHSVYGCHLPCQMRTNFGAARGSDMIEMIKFYSWKRKLFIYLRWNDASKIRAFYHFNFDSIIWVRMKMIYLWSINWWTKLIKCNILYNNQENRVLNL